MLRFLAFFLAAAAAAGDPHPSLRPALAVLQHTATYTVLLFRHSQPLDPWRGSGGSGGGFGREQRDQQLTAKIRSQDSSLRSLRADVTTLRRRLRTQAETLAQQKEDNATVRRAAEQVGQRYRWLRGASSVEVSRLLLLVFSTGVSVRVR